MKLKLLAAVFLATLCAGGASAHAATSIVGADLMEPTLRPLLEAEAGRRGWSLDLALDGSLLGRKALEAGKADLAVLVLPSDDPPKAGFKAWPLAFEVAVVVVNEQNPLKETTFEGLRDLFAFRPADDITKWGQVGLKGAWESRPITLIVERAHDRLFLELFKSRVLGARDIRYNIAYLDSHAAILKAVGDDQTAIAVVAQGEDSPRVRPLFVGLNKSSQAYGPDPQAVFYGDYPLRLATYLVIKEDASKEAQEVGRFLFSDAVAEALNAASYEPVPANERRQFELDLDFAR